MRPAVVLMAYGSPDRLADVPAYYADIRGGRPVRPELLDDLVERYRALGIDDGDGPSPLNLITEETRAALERALGVPRARRACATGSPASRTRSTPLSAEGADTVVGLVLAPHWSSLSIAKYEALFDAAVWPGEPSRGSCESGGPSRASSRSWRSAFALRWTTPEAHVVFTAHSLPARILDDGRHLPGQAARDGRAGRRCRRHRRRVVLLVPERVGDGRAVARSPTSSTTSASCGMRASTRCSSARSGSSPTTWRSAGTSTTRRPAERPELGMRLSRIEMPNADPAFIDVLAGLVQRELALVAT